MTAQEIASLSACFDCTNPGQLQSWIATLLNVIASGPGGLSGSTVTSTSGLSTSTTALAADAARTSFTIQNQATAHLHVKLGAGATTSDFDYILGPAGSAANGTGGVLTVSGYKGVVSVAAAGTPSYTAFSLAPSN